MRRYELSDRQGARISPLFPNPTRHGKPGRPSGDYRRLVNGILWILHTGAPWADRLCNETRPLGRKIRTYVDSARTYVEKVEFRCKAGLTSPNVTGRGRPFSTASTPGVKTAPGSVWPPRCWTSWTTRGSSITTCGVSTAPSSGPVGLPPGRKKRRAAPANSADARRRNSRNRLTMRSGGRGAGLGRRSIWFVRATVPLLPSTSRQVSVPRVSPSSRPWPGGYSTAAKAKGVGRSAGRGQRLQPPAHPAVVQAPSGGGGDPDTEGPTPRRELRQADLRAQEHRRAGSGLVQGVSRPGHSL